VALSEGSRSKLEPAASGDAPSSRVSPEALALVRRRLRDQLRQRVDARGLSTAPRTERRVRVREEALVLLRANGAILPQRELTRMVNEVSDDVVGFGPIEFLLKDPSVTEVMVNGPATCTWSEGGASRGRRMGYSRGRSPSCI
jgi:hypothetical protein